MDNKAMALPVAFPRLRAFHLHAGDVVRLGRFGILTTSKLPAPTTTFVSPNIVIDSENAEQYDILLDGVVVDTISA